jgi:hypothetical protein
MRRYQPHTKVHQQKCMHASCTYRSLIGPAPLCHPQVLPPSISSNLICHCCCCCCCCLPAFPQSCTKGLKSPPGSTSFTACLNPAGFSYGSEGANQCPDNHYATKGAMVSEAACNVCIGAAVECMCPDNHCATRRAVVRQAACTSCTCCA